MESNGRLIVYCLSCSAYSKNTVLRELNVEVDQPKKQPLQTQTGGLISRRSHVTFPLGR